MPQAVQSLKNIRYRELYVFLDQQGFITESAKDGRTKLKQGNIKVSLLQTNRPYTREDVLRVLRDAKIDRE